MSNKWFFLGLVGALLLVAVCFVYYQSSQCREENGWLYGQWVGVGNYVGGGNCSAGCLHMRFIPEYPGVGVTNEEAEAFIGHYRTVENWARIDAKYGRTFYFADENATRGDIPDDTFITVKWCKTPYGERIRGVQPYE